MNIRTYEEARIYLEGFSRPTITDRIRADSKLPNPLDRMRELLSLLGDPQNTFRSVQVSGTAGKGSTTYLISHILTTAGYKVGSTVSPHLQRTNERLQINTLPISDEAFIGLVNEIIPVIEEMEKMPIGVPSYFEILIALAFLYFSREKVDIAVVEVGLEGSFDGTNTLSPLIVILTNIYLDHMQLLGETVEEITGEAVSIIRNDTREIGHEQVVITGARNEAVARMVEEKCRQVGAQLYRLGDEFHGKKILARRNGSVFDYTDRKHSLPELELSLIGSYQIENAAIAIKTVLMLGLFGYSVTEENIRSGLRTAHFAGRFELQTYTAKEHTYRLILDGAHNPAKMEAFITALNELYPEDRKIFLITFKRGKQVEEMVGMIAEHTDTVIITEFHRTLDDQKNASMQVETLEASVRKVMKKKAIALSGYDQADQALKAAFAAADVTHNPLIVVTGSLYLVGEVRDLLTEA